MRLTASLKSKMHNPYIQHNKQREYFFFVKITVYNTEIYCSFNALVYCFIQHIPISEVFYRICYILWVGVLLLKGVYLIFRFIQRTKIICFLYLYCWNIYYMLIIFLSCIYTSVKISAFVNFFGILFYELRK